MRDNKAVAFTGEVTYNGLVPNDDFLVARTAAYIDQRDIHIAEMTVAEVRGCRMGMWWLLTHSHTFTRSISLPPITFVPLPFAPLQTLYFASTCLGPGLSKSETLARTPSHTTHTHAHTHFHTHTHILTPHATLFSFRLPISELHDELVVREQAMGIVPNAELDKLWVATYADQASSALVEMFSKILGIDHEMNTVVGDDLLKGISGGQKKRVTTGEAERGGGGI